MDDAARMEIDLVGINRRTKITRPDLSIIIPCKDEAANIMPLAKEIEAAMATAGLSWECIWVDDGSTDDTRRRIQILTKQRISHRLLAFDRNAGQSASLWAAFHYCQGRLIATLDGDGQNDPADLPAMVAYLKNDIADMVNGFRHQRQDGVWRWLISRVANGFRNLTTGRTVRDVGCSTRVMKSECVQRLPLFAGMHRFLPTLVALHGYRLMEAPVNHRPRQHGQTKYSISNRLWVGLFDCCGVFWLRRRTVPFSIVHIPEQAPSNTPPKG
jgi:dolichol-phosphate mannosyltransferase